METARLLLHLGVWVSVWTPVSTDDGSAPLVDNIQWVSLDFKTLLTWTRPPGHAHHTLTVDFSEEEGDWTAAKDCILMSESQCDLTDDLRPLNRTYQADIKAETPDSDPDTFPHSYSPHFNPYTQSNISAARFSLTEVDQTTVMVNISDPPSGIHDRKQLNIRDILQKDLKYKISYSKSGSTGKRDVISDGSTATVTGLDAGHDYCFMVAAFIPSRSRSSQQGAWSSQLCTDRAGGALHDLSLGAWVGAVFVGLAVLVVIVTVTVLCCRGRRHRNKAVQQTSQVSTPV